LVDLGRLEEAVLTSLTPPVSGDIPDFDTNGLTLGVLSAENLNQFGLGDYTEGVLIMDVDEASVAFDKGLRAGDIITEIGQQAVTSPSDIDERIASAKAGGRTSILLLVHRDGDKRFVALSLVD
jgi:serine protease Do